MSPCAISDFPKQDVFIVHKMYFIKKEKKKSLQLEDATLFLNPLAASAGLLMKCCQAAPSNGIDFELPGGTENRLPK